MTFRLFKQSPFFRSITTSHLPLHIRSFFSIPTRILLKEYKGNVPSLSDDVYNLSPLRPDNFKSDLRHCKIDLVDDETWNMSSGLAEAWRMSNMGTGNARRRVRGRGGLGSEDEGEDEVMEDVPCNNENPDLDEIEDMRFRGSLFFELQKGSEEYEDQKYNFHSRKPQEKYDGEIEGKAQKKENKCALVPGVEKVGKNGKRRNEITNKEASKLGSLFVEDHNQNDNLDSHSILDDEEVNFSDMKEGIISRYEEVDRFNSKTKRTTFKQLTGPYHEPFCLDIYVSNASASASVIHRATSKVVVVAHSISKDLKLHLGSSGSPKSWKACALVGKVLAQRALDDDIHNIIYTPRTGEKLEGKRLIILQAIIDAGIQVKVRLKQRNSRNTHRSFLRTRY